MKKKSKHIIVNSHTNPVLARIVASYLVKEYGFILSTEKDLSSLEEGIHGVAVCSYKEKASTHNTYVANLSYLAPSNTENLSGYIFEDACEYFIGNLTQEQLLTCA